jgi:hypothetical protein
MPRLQAQMELRLMGEQSIPTEYGVATPSPNKWPLQFDRFRRTEAAGTPIKHSDPLSEEWTV